MNIHVSLLLGFIVATMLGLCFVLLALVVTWKPDNKDKENDRVGITYK